MQEIRLPSYPLIPLDPLFSLWSPSDVLSSPVCMWTGKEKPFYGYICVDGKKKRFLGGKGCRAVLRQKKVEAELTATRYTFSDDAIELVVTFTTPCLLKDLKLLSRPISYVDVLVKSVDGLRHEVEVLFSVGERMVYRGWKKSVCAVAVGKEFFIGKIGRKRQTPLAESGDTVEADWGYVYLGGEAEIRTEGSFRKSLVLTKKLSVLEEEKFYFVFGWDDGYAMEYFGKNVRGYWREFYDDSNEAIRSAYREHDETIALCKQEEDAYQGIREKYGEDYYTLLVASYRQVLGGHKLISADGQPVLISKECSSNGCCATVDVTYPSAPLFLAENPVLLKAMLLPVFTFARSKAWKYDFAPHDCGRYPYVMGQVYGLRREYDRKKLADKKPPIFTLENDDLFSYALQMPVEESGNMLILTACYYNETGDEDFVRENFDLLSRWADYLVRKGIDLETQLSTDDFGGKLPKNVNLAVKSVSAVALWGLLCNKLSENSGNGYLNAAKRYAEELLKQADRGDRLALITDEEDGWGVKYNLVWDKIFRLNLFGEKIWQRESDYYRTKLNRYGLPMDSRHTYCKTDWQIWASVLCGDDSALRAYSETLVRRLQETPTRRPYADLIETVAPSFTLQSNRRREMYARTVQGGMWLPVFAQKVRDKKNYLL